MLVMLSWAVNHYPGNAKHLYHNGVFLLEFMQLEIKESLDTWNKLKKKYQKKREREKERKGEKNRGEPFCSSNELYILHQ